MDRIPELNEYPEAQRLVAELIYLLNLCNRAASIGATRIKGERTSEHHEETGVGRGRKDNEVFVFPIHYFYRNSALTISLIDLFQYIYLQVPQDAPDKYNNLFDNLALIEKLTGLIGLQVIEDAIFLNVSVTFTQKAYHLVHDEFEVDCKEDLVVNFLAQIYFYWLNRTEDTTGHLLSFDPFGIVVFTRREELTISASGLYAYIQTHLEISVEELQMILKQLETSGTIHLHMQDDVHEIDSEYEITLTQAGQQLISNRFYFN